MSGNDGDLDAIRQQRMAELQARQQQATAQDMAQEQALQQAEMQKQAILRQFLTDGARTRLNSVRMSKPEFASQVEQQIIALAQSGRLGDKISESQMKDLLQKLAPSTRKSFDIKRR
jgi:programmed cell death protein 5